MARKTSVTTNSATHLARSVTPQKALSRFEKLLEQVPQLKQGDSETLALQTWRQNIEILLSQFYGAPSVQLEKFQAIRYSLSFFSSATPESDFTEARLDGISKAEAYIRSRLEEIREDLSDVEITQSVFVQSTTMEKDRRKVFVVHGHDDGAKETVARYLSKLGLDPIILHEQPNKGRTIIEKFEDYADVSCAVVILTPDDTAASKKTPDANESRARQNVIFEMGFFVGKLGRTHTFALLHSRVSKPSDIDGLLYISMDTGTWRMELVGELKAAGLDIDANKAFE